MSIMMAFALVGVGIALNSVHHYICRKIEIDAFNNGYQQAQKEMKIAERSRYSYRPWLTDSETCQPNNKITLPDSFMESLHNNGHAAVRIR